MIRSIFTLTVAFAALSGSWIPATSFANELPLRRDCARIASQAEKLLSGNDERSVTVEVIKPPIETT